MRFTLSLLVLLFTLTSPAVAMASPPDLSGTWAMKMVTTSNYRLAVVAQFTSVSTSIIQVNITQDGHDLTLHTQFCSIDMSNTAPGIQPHLSSGFLESMTPNQRPGRLRRKQNSWRLHIPKMWDIHGMRMDDPDNDPMPEDADDPRVFDQDGNGHPGFTLHLEGRLGGDMHLAQRIWDQFDGELLSDDEIRGQVRWDSDQSVLDATSRRLRSNPTNEPNLDESSFQMVRVYDGLSCADLMSQADRLFLE